MQVEFGTRNDVRRMSDVEAAYLAAFVDGEGSVHIYRSNQRAKRPYYGFRLGVTNTDFSVLKKIQEFTGCGCFAFRRRSKDPKWKDCGFVYWQAGQGANILLQILPHMRLKILQADVALKFMDAKRRMKELGQDTYSEQEFYYAEMRRLNARGKAQQKYTEFKRAVRVEKSCTYPGCTSKHWGRGYCRKHYKWVYVSLTHSERKERKCEQCGSDIPDNKQLSAKFCCVACKMRWYRKHGCYSPEKQVDARKCGDPGCDRPHQAQGLCRRHYMQRWHAANKRPPSPPKPKAPKECSTCHRTVDVLATRKPALCHLCYYKGKRKNYQGPPCSHCGKMENKALGLCRICYNRHRNNLPLPKIEGSPSPT